MVRFYRRIFSFNYFLMALCFIYRGKTDFHIHPFHCKVSFLSAFNYADSAFFSHQTQGPCKLLILDC